jgi:hypothetical protein
MRKLARGGVLPDLTGRGCTLAAPAAGGPAAACRQTACRETSGRQTSDHWCRTGTGLPRRRGSLPRCALAPRPN